MTTRSSLARSALARSAPLHERIRVRFASPVFRRELLTLLRSRRSFLILGGYLLASAAVVVLAWPQGGGAVLVQGDISRQVFGFFTLAQTLLVAVAVPAVLASSFSGEKEHETLDVILTTPLSGRHLLLGKLLSGIVYLLLLLAVSVPVVLLCYSLGGLSGVDVLGLYASLALQVVVYGLVALVCSLHLQRTTNALIAAYMIVASLAVGTRLLYGDGLGFVESGGLHWLAALAAVLAMLLYRASVRRLGKPFDPVQRGIEQDGSPKDLALLLDSEAWPDRWILPSRDGLLADRSNPVYQKEARCELYGAGTRLVRVLIQFGVVGSLVVMLASMVVMAGAGSYAPEYYYQCFLVAYVMLLAPALAASNITQEKEQGTIESLLMTLLPPRRIVLGKLGFVVRVVTILALFNSVCYAELVLFFSDRPMGLVELPLVVMPSIVLAAALGSFFSLHLRSTLAATVSTYASLLVLLVGPLLLEGFLEVVMRSSMPAFLEVLDLLTPFLAARGGTEEMLAHAAILLVASALLVGVTVRRFDRVIRGQLGGA